MRRNELKIRKTRLWSALLSILPMDFLHHIASGGTDSASKLTEIRSRGWHRADMTIPMSVFRVI